MKLTSKIAPNELIEHVESLAKRPEPRNVQDILDEILEEVKPVDFKEKLHETRKRKLSEKDLQVISVQECIDTFSTKNYHVCQFQATIFIYNGCFWGRIGNEDFGKFLGIYSCKIGIDKFSALHFTFKENLLKQFFSAGFLKVPDVNKELMFINLLNGTLEIGTNGIKFRRFNADDFLRYQLPFELNPNATRPIFQGYLDKVLPGKEEQHILAEYLGYSLIRRSTKCPKVEKALLLYGSGSNGKSVFFEVVNAIFGEAHISHISLGHLTDVNGYYRAGLANKLINFASEISTSFDINIFKQIVSGEPTMSRLPNKPPVEIKEMATLIFNCNELPRDVEHTWAFYRRLLIINFGVQIPENEQDKLLHRKIINNELPGVFNWILEGLKRFIGQNGFTHSPSAESYIKSYRVESDSVQLFMEELNFEASISEYCLLRECYSSYRSFCLSDGYKPVNKTNFKKRLEGAGVAVERKNVGIVVFMRQKSF